MILGICLEHSPCLVLVSMNRLETRAAEGKLVQVMFDLKGCALSSASACTQTLGSIDCVCRDSHLCPDWLICDKRVHPRDPLSDRGRGLGNCGRAGLCRCSRRPCVCDGHVNASRGVLVLAFRRGIVDGILNCFHIEQQRGSSPIGP